MAAALLKNTEDLPVHAGPGPALPAAAVLHDAAADGGGDGGEQLDAAAVVTGWEDGKHGAPLTLHRHHCQLSGAVRKCWVCVSDTSAGWRDGGCGGSSHPGAPMAKSVVEGLGWAGGGVPANGGRVWTDDPADALRVDCR